MARSISRVAKTENPVPRSFLLRNHMETLATQVRLKRVVFFLFAITGPADTLGE